MYSYCDSFFLSPACYGLADDLSEYILEHERVLLCTILSTPPYVTYATLRLHGLRSHHSPMGPIVYKTGFRTIIAVNHDYNAYKTGNTSSSGKVLLYIYFAGHL